MRKRHVYKRNEKRKDVLNALRSVDQIVSCNNLNLQFGFVCSQSIIQNTCDLCHGSSINIDWEIIPKSLDPAAGELNAIRSRRKREQISSIFKFVVIEMDYLLLCNKSIVIWDFGAGSGHLGLFLAYYYPNVHVVLAERKEYCVNVAKSRICDSGLNNVTIYCEDLKAPEAMAINNSKLVLGVSMHSCGLFTDIALRWCVDTHASFVLVPCCYGQITSPPPAFRTEEMIRSSSESLKSTVSIYQQEQQQDDDNNNLDRIAQYRSDMLFKSCPELLSVIASGADHSGSFDDNIIAIALPTPTETCLSSTCLQTDHSKCSSAVDNMQNSCSYSYEPDLGEQFWTARRCMRAVDLDRAVRVCEDHPMPMPMPMPQSTPCGEMTLHGHQSEVINERDDEDNWRTTGLCPGHYSCALASLHPLTCSPKNNVIIGRFVRSHNE